MAKALAPDGVTVNAISPGIFDSAMTTSAGDDLMQWRIDNTPLGRLGNPTEMASAVKFLVVSDFITGHNLVIDGGLTLH